jgi:DNA uptake protein ComE-like DNA-binding protein
MIINNRIDLDAAPEQQRQAFIDRLAASIYSWAWQDGDWVQVTDTATLEQFDFTVADFPDAPVPDKPTTNPDEEAAEAALAEARANRAAAYAAEADPLFFKAQRGEGTMQDWEDKVAEIRTRYPYPDDAPEPKEVINVNSATKTKLKSLNGVDAMRAQAIIDGRPWADINDLANVQGISQDMINGWSVKV